MVDQQTKNLRRNAIFVSILTVCLGGCGAGARRTADRGTRASGAGPWQSGTGRRFARSMVAQLAVRLSGETRLPALPAEVLQAFVSVWQQAIHLAQAVADQALVGRRQVLDAER